MPPTVNEPQKGLKGEHLRYFIDPRQDAVELAASMQNRNYQFIFSLQQGAAVPPPLHSRPTELHSEPSPPRRRVRSPDRNQRPAAARQEGLVPAPTNPEMVAR